MTTTTSTQALPVVPNNNPHQFTEPPTSPTISTPTPNTITTSSSTTTMLQGPQPPVPLSMYGDNLASLSTSPKGPAGDNINYNRSNSARNINMGTPKISPARPSLVGFDPLMSNGMQQHQQQQQLLRGPAPPTISNRSKSMSSAYSPAQPLTPVMNTTTTSSATTTHARGHVRASSDLSRETQERILKEQNSSSSRMRLQSADATVVMKTSSNHSTPPRHKKLPTMFVKKDKQKPGHHRVRSLDGTKNIESIFKRTSINAQKDQQQSLPNTPMTKEGGDDEQKSASSSMYPSIVQDLMNLKMNNLEIPSLAKPSPTSFLTGKDDEVVRTCEMEPTPYQTDIPSLSEFVVTSRLNEFVDSYRKIDQNFDLQEWVGLSRMDLRQVKIPQHVPIAESILQCGDDVSIRGVVTASGGTSADERLEVVVFEGQRQFTAVFRGTTEQQAKPGGRKQKKEKAVPLDAEHGGSVEVYSCFLEDYKKLEAECFALLDKLTDEEPFCDVVFSGHSFGAALATLGAFRYANARPMMRASCLAFASPKVGFSVFRQMVNSLPNLKVMRVELGQDGKCQTPGVGGSHVGHTLLLSNKTSKPVLAYKFETPKFKFTKKTTHPDLRAYVSALEELTNQKGDNWINDFVGTAGEGVVVNNEARLVV